MKSIEDITFADIDATTYYTDSPYKQGNIAAAVRCIADIGGPCNNPDVVEYSKKAWDGLSSITRTDDTYMCITRENSSESPHGWNPTTTMKIDGHTAKAIDQGTYPLKAVMGHTPVGYFPLVRNHVLMNDVSASFTWKNNQRTSFPMVKLTINDQAWEVHVKCTLDLTLFNDQDLPRGVVTLEMLRLNECFGGDTIVEYQINEQIMLKHADIMRNMRKHGEPENLMEMVGKLVGDSGRYLYRETLSPFTYAYHIMNEEEEAETAA